MSNLPILQILTSIILISLVAADNLTCNYLAATCQANILSGTTTYENYENLNTSQLIQHFGYPVEVHKITTEDGYILTAQRIPHSNSSPLNASSPKIPVFLMHGVFVSSAQWFWQEPTRALVFMLADAGYDVWLGNARGTTYSSESAINVSTTSKEFWNFSHHEMAKYDLPAFFEYIRNTTNQPSMYYIGHSLGTTQLFVAAALNPSIQSYVRTFIALAPIAFAGNATNLFARSTSPLYAPYQTASLLSPTGPMFPSTVASVLSGTGDYCANSAVDCTVCAVEILALFGLDPCQTDFTRLPGFMAHTPDSVSAKTFSHVCQDYQWGTFNQYNYGLAGNMKAYGKAVPPTYEFGKNYTIPTVFFHSDSDTLAVALDVERTAAVLGSALKEKNRVPYTSWTHMDFVIGIDADIYVYNRILQIFNGKIYG